MADEQGLALARLKAALRSLLETGAPFTSIAYQLPELVSLNGLRDLAPKALDLPCPRCKAESRTWTHIKQYEQAIAVPGEAHATWKYMCSDCENSHVLFWIAFKSEVSGELPRSLSRGGNIPATRGGKVTKVVQWPRWGVRVPKRVEKALGEHADLLKRGIHCLESGYGIGAAAYFRRVIEDEATAIVELVRDAARQDGDSEAVTNAEEALRQNSAAGRLEIASRRLPPSIRVDGRNPLEPLYGALSGPLHSETEEQAVEIAAGLLETLIYLFEALRQRMDEKQRYADGIRTAAKRQGQRGPRG